MDFPLIAAPDIPIKEEGYRPIPIPKILHHSRKQWMNRGETFYRENFGGEGLLNIVDLPMPMPEASPLRLASSIRVSRIIMGMSAYFSGKRSKNAFGTGAKGTLTIVDNDELPEHDFFRPGRTFNIRLRHSNQSYEDDAASQARGLAIKFADTDFESPLDLVLGTGGIQPFWNMSNYYEYMVAHMKSSYKEGHFDGRKSYLKKNPTAYVAMIEAMRLAPESYAMMTYYGVNVFPWMGKDEIRRYVKFRVVPQGLEQESGLLPEEYQKKPWDQMRHPNNNGPEKYLAKEFRKRVKREPVKYSLQIQIRMFNEGSDTDEFFNSVRYWPDNEYRWQKLADIEIDQPLEDEETEKTRFWLGNTPETLGIIEAKSKHDYNSIIWGRANIYNYSYRMRKIKSKY